MEKVFSFDSWNAIVPAYLRFMMGLLCIYFSNLKIKYDELGGKPLTLYWLVPKVASNASALPWPKWPISSLANPSPTWAWMVCQTFPIFIVNMHKLWVLVHPNLHSSCIVICIITLPLPLGLPNGLHIFCGQLTVLGSLAWLLFVRVVFPEFWNYLVHVILKNGLHSEPNSHEVFNTQTILFWVTRGNVVINNKSGLVKNAMENVVCS